MKPLFEFLVACLLVSIAGCSAIAGIFQAGIWTTFIVGGSVLGLIILFKTKARQ